MGKITELLQKAQQRAKESKAPYEGVFLPAEAYEVMQTVPHAKLVDVRTKAELDWVGRVPGSVDIEWLSYPGMSPNPNFISQLKQQVDPESLVLFMCRSGARSHAAAIAATEAGYADCYNVLEGFEGDKDKSTGQRGRVGGWKAVGLPWSQS